MAVIYLFI